MKLRELLDGVDVLETAGSLDVEVTGVRCDSRRVRAGDLFVAVSGEKSDGHEFVADAVKAGAAAVVCERRSGGSPVTQLRVRDARLALARLASRVHGSPSGKLRVVGITGTNGKTTTSFLIASILEAAGLPAGVLGTISWRVGNRELPAPNTTPGADELHEMLGRMVQAGMKAVVMEVSSHALAQHRVEEVAWDAGVFTNLTQDHLDYHKTMEAYGDAKRILFDRLGASKKAAAILNRDDPAWEKMRAGVREGVTVLTYGLADGADVRAVAVEQAISGCRFRLAFQGREIFIETPLCGAHNVSNCLAAAATGLAMGFSLEIIGQGIASVKNVPGRLERLEARTPAGSFAVVVDYAHTHDALRNVLGTLRPLTRGRLITVFGCGGNRDPMKRPLMGRVATELSDLSIVTTDNPRNEDPAAIVKQIEAGIGSGKKYRVVLDRREAIREAVAMAAEGDVVLLAGKGHETYQEVAGVRSPFDDRKVALELLESMKGGASWKN